MKTSFTKKRNWARASLVNAMVALLGCTSSGATAAELPTDWQERVKLGVRAYEKGEQRYASDTFYKLMMDGDAKFGSADGRMARLYTNMGQVYSEEHKYSYAEQCLKRGLHIAETGFGKSAIQTVPALIDLAQLYVAQGGYTKAQPLFKRALAIVDKPGDEENVPYVLVIEADLGSMFFAAGNYSFGEPHFRKASLLAAKALGPNHPWTTTIGGMYAACLRAEGKKKEAKAIEQAAVNKANETQTPIFIWNQQIALADAAIAEKRYSDAEVALKLALQASQRDLSSEPMLQALTLHRYGQLLILQNKPALGVEKWKAAQSLADSALGLEDSAVLDHAKELADLERSKDQFPDAEPLYLRLVTHAKKVSGPESDQYAKALADIAGLYESWAQYPKAVTYYSKLLVLQEKQFGADSEKLIPTLVALGKVTQNNTEYLAEVNIKAEEHLKRAVDLASKKFGSESKEVAAILDVLSRYYQSHRDWEKAAATCTKVIAADEKNFGPESAETIKALEHYAVVLRAAGWRNQAEPIEARVARIKGTNSSSDN